MIEVGRQWHVNHVVDDYRRVSDWYHDVFGAVDVFTDQWLEAEQRWASMVTIGDLAVDVMQPTSEGAHLPLGRFLSRFGSHLHAAAYFVSSPPVDVFDALTEQGVRCFSLAGAGRQFLVENPVNPVFTHPRDTPGQLEFMPFVDSKPGPLGVPGMWEDPRYLPGWSVERWRRHPLAITGWRVGVVVRELDRAIEIYYALGAKFVAREESSGGRRCRLHLGTNTVVELISPLTDDTLAAQDLAANGEILHSLVFETDDLASAEAHLIHHGVVIAERDGKRLVTDPASCFGAVFEFVPTMNTTGGP